MNQIPAVILHKGYRDYVKVNAEVTSKNNPVILIGSEEFKDTGNSEDIDYYNIDDYYDHTLFDSFVNYSTNSKLFEWLCISKMFVLKKFMKENKIDKLFHLDSDCILLRPVEKFSFEKENALMKNQNFDNKFRMGYPVHVALISLSFLEQFEFVFSKIYLDKEKNPYKDMIMEKVDFHKRTNTPGGICDMTLCYLLEVFNLIDIQNLHETRNGYAFMNTLGSPEGLDSKHQYKTENNFMVIDSATNEIYDTINNKSYKLMNIHFQGGYKQLLTHDWIDKNLNL